jgi:hypothetical protein
MEKTVNIRMGRRPAAVETKVEVVEPVTEAKALCWAIISLLVSINASMWYVYLT